MPRRFGGSAPVLGLGITDHSTITTGAEGIFNDSIRTDDVSLDNEVQRKRTRNTDKVIYPQKIKDDSDYII